MKLTWHLVGKDLRRFTWPLVALALVILLKLAIGVVLVSADANLHPQRFSHYETLANFLIVLEVGVVAVLTAAAVQEDALVGTRAFWTTRPISGPRLLGTKLLMLGLSFFALPLLLTLPWWLYCGLTPAQIAKTAGETVLWHAFTITAALPFAVLTRTLGRFLAVVVIAALTAIVLQMALRTGLFGLDDNALPRGARFTRTWLLITFAAVAAATLVVHQYFTRRFSRSIAIAASAIAIGFVVGCFWRWDWWPLFSSRTSGRGKAIVISVDSAQRSTFETRRGHKQITVTFQAAGIPPDRVLLPGESRQKWISPDGSTVTRLGTVRSIESDPLLLPPTVPRSTSSAPPPAPQRFHSTAVVRSKLTDVLAAAPARLDFDVYFALLEPAALGELPLEPGATLCEKGTKLRLVSVDESNHGQRQVRLIESFPSVFTDDKQPGASLRPRYRGVPDLRLVASQRDTEIVPDHAGNRVRIAGVGIWWRVLTLPASFDEDLSNLRVAKLDTESMEWVHRRVSVPSIQIN
jgi:hypothetical protein